MKTDQTDLLSQFDNITIKKRSILTKEDTEHMKHLQSMFEPVYRQLLAHYKAMKKYADEHPTDRTALDSSIFSWSLYSEAYRIKNDYSRHNYYLSNSFCPENTTATISKKILDLAVQFEKHIYIHIEDEHGVKLRPEWCLLKTIFPDHWQNFRKKELNRWSELTEFNLEYEGDELPAVCTEGEIPTWQTVIKTITGQLQGQTFEEVHRSQRLSELKKMYFRTGLKERTVSFKSAEHDTYEKNYKAPSKIFFKLDRNPYFEMLMLYENKDRIAIPKTINPETGEFNDKYCTHNIEIPLEGSSICLAMTMMKNGVLKLHFKDENSAKGFRDWCITDSEGKTDLSKTF